MELQDVTALISALIAAGTLVFSVINSTFRLRATICELIMIRDGNSNAPSMRAYLDVEINRLTARLIKRIKEHTLFKTALIWTFAAGIAVSLGTYLQEMLFGDTSALSQVKMALWFAGIGVAFVAAVIYLLVRMNEGWQVWTRHRSSASSENMT